MSKQSEREAINQAMKKYKKPIRLVTEEQELEEMADKSMRDGEMNMVRNYHFQDGTVGKRFY